MGLNILKSILDGALIRDTDYDQYYDALSGDFVPRAKDGSPNADVSSVGRAINRWSSGYLKEILMGSGVNLKENSTSLSIEIANTEKVLIDTGISLTEIADGTVTDLAANSPFIKDADVLNGTVTGTTPVLLTGASLSVNLNGRPIILGIQGAEGLTSSVRQGTATSTDRNRTTFEILRTPGSIPIAQDFFGAIATSSYSTDFRGIPTMLFYDYPSASPNSYTYTLRIQCGASVERSIFENMQLFYIEL